MSALFLSSVGYGVTANEQSVAPARRMTLDEPGLVYRSTGNLATITATSDASLFIADSVAVTGARLLATDTIRVRAGSVPDMTSGVVADVTTQAWTGTSPIAGATCLIALPSPVMARYFRIDITTGNTFVEISRLLIGRRIEVDGIDEGAVITFTSGSPQEGPGWTTVLEQRTRLAWKANVGNIHRTLTFTSWAPFLSSVGTHAAFLFIPDTDTVDLQRQAALVRLQSNANLVEVTGDRYRVELNVLEV